ncbi:MAG: hypothetical protein EBQ92_08270 [Proteobacteria bacterium]|nr:hypothetical protein [Pseudomonadota bacterium]
MIKTAVRVSLVFLLLIAVKIFAASSDWYSYYIQCVASSSQESTCYDAIRDYLSTEEGKKQAEEIGFKRQLFRDSNQVITQAVVISNRIVQMETYLSNALEKAREEKDAIRSFCLNDKSREMAALKRNVDEKKSHVLQIANQAVPEAVENEYQLILSLNSRANALYLQARKCLE